MADAATTIAPKSKGAATKDRILEVSEKLILKQGYAGTSIEDILTHAHITKGGFFYHFQGKNDLAIALMERYQVNDRTFFVGLADRAQNLVEDPLQQLLLFLKLLADAMSELPEVHPGCLVATFVYESQQVDADVQRINREVIEVWRGLFREQILRADEIYSRNLSIEVDTLADNLTSVIEGGIIVSKALNEKKILTDQILQYRNYIKLLYAVQ
jgi:AcrR family transcriptional regulator